MKLILTFTLIVLSFGMFAQMTKREQQVLDEINLVRTNPKAYIQYIDSFLEYWDSDSGERATAEELKRELKKMTPLPALVFSPDLYKSSKKHGEYILKTKKFAHSDCDCGENIQYGNSEIRYAVIDLLIDNGVSDRGHRKNILNPNYKYFAVYELLEVAGDMEFVFVQQFDY